MFLFSKKPKEHATSEIVIAPTQVCSNIKLIEKLRRSLEKQRNEATTLDHLLETMLRFMPMYAWIRDVETGEVTFKNHGSKCDVFFTDEMVEVDVVTSEYVRRTKDGACFLYEGEDTRFTLPLVIKIPIVVKGEVTSEVCFGLDLNTLTGIALYERIHKLEADNSAQRLGKDNKILLVDSSIIVLN
jgi:hypothetical protein